MKNVFRQGKMSKINNVILLRWSFIFFVIVSLSFCATSQKRHIQADQAYVAGDYEKAIQTFEPLKAKQDKNYLLYMMDIGMTYFSAGDYYDSEKYFMTVEKSLEKQIGDLKTGEQLLVSDQRKIFLGDPADKVMTHLFLGIGFFIREDYDSAEIEFKKALESDRGKEDKYEGDLVTANFFLGEIYLNRKQLDKAGVAYRKTAEINPQFSYSWLGLYLVAKLEKNTEKMDKYWREYIKLTGDKLKPEEIENRGKVIVLDLLGWGPMKKPDPFFGAMSLVKPRSYTTNYAEHSFMVENVDWTSKDYSADDMYFQANTAGGFTAAFTKKLVGAVARKAVSYIPIVGGLTNLVLGGNEADTRFWFTLPGKINLMVAFLVPGLYDFKVKMFDMKGQLQERFQQNWYYVPVKASKSTVLVLRSIFDLHNMAPKK